eukprot:TRINITY_DN5114_c0_g1_i2.p1 TRINITY_DN5114_c0_g1~~TRINITY_DN5114_c0_g1_i2.p1  ORF type:complete len:629 (-),score=116.96 TRINITY_DN5114_c0_g1_i2:520-2142(-)
MCKYLVLKGANPAVTANGRDIKDLFEKISDTFITEIREVQLMHFERLEDRNREYNTLQPKKKNKDRGGVDLVWNNERIQIQEPDDGSKGSMKRRANLLKQRKRGNLQRTDRSTALPKFSTNQRKKSNAIRKTINQISIEDQPTDRQRSTGNITVPREASPRYDNPVNNPYARSRTLPRNARNPRPRGQSITTIMNQKQSPSRILNSPLKNLSPRTTGSPSLLNGSPLSSIPFSPLGSPRYNIGTMNVDQLNDAHRISTTNLNIPVFDLSGLDEVLPSSTDEKSPSIVLELGKQSQALLQVISVMHALPGGVPMYENEVRDIYGSVKILIQVLRDLLSNIENYLEIIPDTLREDVSSIINQIRNTHIVSLRSAIQALNQSTEYFNSFQDVIAEFISSYRNLYLVCEKVDPNTVFQALHKLMTIVKRLVQTAGTEEMAMHEKDAEDQILVFCEKALDFIFSVEEYYKNSLFNSLYIVLQGTRGIIIASRQYSINPTENTKQKIKALLLQITKYVKIFASSTQDITSMEIIENQEESSSIFCT